MTRYAIRVFTNTDTDRVLAQARIMERYMPSNYAAFPVRTAHGTLGVLIVGEDSHGWTLSDYVLPRLASGLYAANEIPASEALNAWTRIGAA